jgi:hypothetical protein
MKLGLSLRKVHRLWVFENRVLRRIFGPKRVEMTGVWKNLHNEELYNLYLSPSIIRMIKSKSMRWTGHVARMRRRRRRRMHIGYWWESHIEGDYWEDQEFGWWTILKLILERWDGMNWMHVVQDREQWRALLNMVMYLGVP